MRVCSAEDLVARKLGSDELADDISVSKSNYESVFGRAVFVFGLSDELLTSLEEDVRHLLTMYYSRFT